MSDELLKQRQVKFVDIRVDDGSQTPASVVAEFASQRSGRGPLANDWIQTVEPVMCCYKLTTIKCSIAFFSGKVESTVDSVSFLFKNEACPSNRFCSNKWKSYWNSLNNAS